MAHNINSIEQFKQCLHDLGSSMNNIRAAAEAALNSLETDNGELYVTYLLESLTDEEELLRTFAGLILKNSLKKDVINHSLYDRIFEQYLFVTGELNNLWIRPNNKVLPYILLSLLKNQLTNNIDTIFNKYMILFDDKSQIRVTHALLTAEFLFEDRSELVKTNPKNSYRLQLVFDKLVHFLKLNDSKFSRYLYPALVAALESAAEYLSDESVRSLVLQRALELVDVGVATGYQVLAACLSQVYEHLEPFMERLVKGSIKVDDSPNVFEDQTSFDDRVEKVFFFWSNLCNLEQIIREDNEEFLYLEIPSNAPYLELLQRYGDQVIAYLFLLMSSLQLEYHTHEENDSWCDFFLQCIADISNAFNIDISPELDTVTAGRTKLLLSTESHWTQTFAKIKDNSFSDGNHPIHLRLPPSFLAVAVNSEWRDLRDPQRIKEVKDTFIAGAGEYLPMYDRSLQEKCMHVACECIVSQDETRFGAVAEILRLKLTNSNKSYSDFVIMVLHKHLSENHREVLQDEEVNSFKTLVQLYSVPERILEEFMSHYMICSGFDPDPCSVFYYLIKPLQQVQQFDDVFDKVILEEFEKEKGKYDNALQLLGLLCQKIGAAIPSEMYSEIWKRLRALSHHSYNIFDTMACVSPPAGVSHLSHLETIVDLFEKKLRVTDDVQVEYAIRGLTTLIQTFKKTSNEFLFVGQIKRIIDLLQPALENEPSIETTRAYLTFIRSLSTIDQASNALRSESVMSVLKHASEESDGTTRHLALNVKKALELNAH